MVRHNSTRVDEGMNVLKSSRDKSARCERTVAVKGEKSLLCDPVSELRLGGRQKRRAKTTNGMEKKRTRLAPKLLCEVV